MKVLMKTVVAPLSHDMILYDSGTYDNGESI